jgi:hypothetical protein
VYDYTSALERVGTAPHAGGGSGEAPYRAYSLDANGSVEGLQGDTGDDTGQRYFYDPYVPSAGRPGATRRTRTHCPPTTRRTRSASRATTTAPPSRPTT